MEHNGHGRRYRLGLLVAAAAIIAAGVALKPKEKVPTPVPELESARLRRMAQERRLQELGEYISYAAQTAARSLVYLPALDQTGVALDPTTLATGLRHIDAPLIRATSAARALDLAVQSRRPDVPVLLLRPAGGATLPPAPRAEVDTGDWVIAVALREDATPVFAYGLYESSTEARCGPLTYDRLRASIPLTAAFVGGGLFSLRGALAGLIARCDNEIVVLSVGSVASALSRPVAPNDWLQDRYGLRVEAGDGGLGAISVWADSPASRAGIRPGDGIATIDGQPVETPEAMLEALRTEGEHDIVVARGRKSVRIQLLPSPPPGDIEIPAAGFTLAGSAAGAVVRSVRGDGPAARAGLLPGDVIVRQRDKPVESAAALAAAFDSARDPVVLAVERAGSVFQARLTP